MWLGVLIGFIVGAYTGIILMATVSMSRSLEQGFDTAMDEPPYLY